MNRRTKTYHNYKRVCAAFTEKLTHFQDSSYEQDLAAITSEDNCVHREYELNRLSGLIIHIDKGKHLYQKERHHLTPNQKEQVDHLQELADVTLEYAHALQKQVTLSGDPYQSSTLQH